MLFKFCLSFLKDIQFYFNGLIHNVLWFYKDLPPYILTAHKSFIESWYEVVNEAG
jgi:hypothetical protein